MKKLITIATFAALATLGTIPVKAADVTYEPVVEEQRAVWYVTIAAGYKWGEEWEDDVHGEFLNNFIEVNTDIDLDTSGGVRGSLAVGYQVSPIFGIEIEASALQQDWDHYDVGDIDLRIGNAHANIPCNIDPCSGNLDGDLNIYTLMLNGMLFMPNVIGGIVPYIGAGIGAAFIDVDGLGVNELNLDNLIDNTDTVLAGQILGGLMVPVTQSIGIGIRGRVLFLGDLEETGDQFGFDHDLDSDPIGSVEATLTFGL